MDQKFIRYRRNIHSPLLRHPRDLIIWLPPSYFTKRQKRYPVLYVHDGQNMIDPATSFLGVTWGLDRVAKRLIKKGTIKEFIAVGIYNTRDRGTEYSGGPRGKNYARFLVEHIKPFIDKTYRTLPDPANTANLGASMGGLIAFLIAWWHPDVVPNAACFSSAFLWKHNSIIKEVRAYKRQKRIRIYLDCGTKELDRHLLPGYKQMVEVLKEKGYKKGVDLEYFFDKDGDHTEKDWSRRLWRPLKFFYGV
ncbi:MAG TPA: alpha/beta hydrolase-fold protein [Acidobacteriota bacterium]|nr:alpha/beta hydrolase-fold protein [Acidobacteriota bacterium]